jgi:hypothetical protein
MSDQAAGWRGWPHSRRPGAWAGVAAATAFALVLQIAFFIHRAPLNGDEGNYVLNAVHMARGEFARVNTYWSPLMSALGAALIRLGADPEVALRGINIVAVTALVPLAAWLAAATFGPTSAWLAAWLVAVCPLAADLGASAMSEPTAAALGAVGLALAIPRRKQDVPRRASALRFAAAGAVIALGGFARAETWPLIVAVPLLAAWDHSTRRLRAAGAAILAALLCLGVCVIAARSAGVPPDRMSKVRINLNLAQQGLLEDSPRRELSLYGLDRQGERVAERSVARIGASEVLLAIRRGLRELPVVAADLFRVCGSPFPLLLAPLGLLVARRREGVRAAPWALAWSVLVPVLASALTLPAPRYLLATVPGLMCLGAAGVAYFAATPAKRAEATSNEPVRPGWWAACVAALLLLPLPWTVGRPLARMASVPRAYRDAGSWMREHGLRGSMLARPGTYVSIYAGVPEYTFMPATDIESALSYARRHGISFMVLDSWLPLEVRPGFGALLTADGAADGAASRLGLERLHSEPLPDSGRVVVYRVLPTGTDQSPAQRRLR